MDKWIYQTLLMMIAMFNSNKSTHLMLTMKRLDHIWMDSMALEDIREKHQIDSRRKEMTD